MWRADRGSRTQGNIAAGNIWAWAASRVQSSVALAKIKASHSCAQERVANLLQELNPDGTRERRRRKLTRRRYISYGPNFCWHVDGKN